MDAATTRALLHCDANWIWQVVVFRAISDSTQLL